MLAPGVLYDVNRRDRFEALFGGLDVGRDPTPERNCYRILNTVPLATDTVWCAERLQAESDSPGHADVLSC